MIYTANRVEIFGEDANSFNPNRKLKSQQNLWGLTFGIGLHMCLEEFRCGVSQIRNRPIKTSVWCCNIIDKKAF